ncbi:MAG: transposase [Candidatus Omnitrophota bacterium]
MPRTARIIIPETAHHIVQRGNNRQNVFEEAANFRNYCYWINKYASQYKVSILAYCLMNNHVHFIVVPQDTEGLPCLFRTVHMRYAQYANYKKNRSGHLWQGRYFSCVLDEEHLFYAIRYVEQNPVRAKMVKYPWDYEWSSAKRHVHQTAENYIKITNTKVVDSAHWKSYLLSNDNGIDDEIRKKTQPVDS